ncbi:FAD-dependent thymidylate synthase [bacterium]|nr:FAD-dependent thymidylate synthase [bacterium]
MKVTLENWSPDPEKMVAKSTAHCRLSDTTSDTKNKNRVRAVIRAGHMSALGQASATISVTGISRACSHQLVRHVFIRYQQQSQRSIQAAPVFIIPPLPYIEDVYKRCRLIRMIEEDCIKAYERYSLYLTCGMRKEDARYILPAASETGMWMHSTLQGWWDLLYGSRSYVAKEDTKLYRKGDVVMLGASRLDKHAQWEIQSVAVEIEKLLKDIAPNIFRRNFS